jgi:acetyl esterase/lipase
MRDPLNRRKLPPEKMTLSRKLAKVAIWLLAALVAAVGVAWWASRPAVPGAFYEAPAGAVPEAGALLRSEAFETDVPAGARAWRILYATTRGDGAPALASAIVMTSTAARDAPRAVIAWAHGTTGIVPGCAPAVMGKPFAHVPALAALLDEGWVYVATDYAGLGTQGPHAYLVGEEAARGVLDAVRAARRLEGLSLANRVVVWGHSQGGNSALWTGMRAARYSPDVTVLGIAALAPASDLKALVKVGQATMFGKIVSAYALHAYGAVYPDVEPETYLKTGTRLLAGDIAARCVGDWGTVFSALQTMLLPQDGIFARDPTAGPFGERLDQNSPFGPFAMPVLVAQGETDDLVLPDIQDRYVGKLCGAGQPVTYRRYQGRDHLSLVAPDSPLGPDLIAWTRDRLAGLPAESNCDGLAR